MRASPLLFALIIALPEAQASNDLLDLSLEDLLATPITVTSRFDEGIRDTPAAVRVIRQQDIQQRNYRNLLDVLQDLPGFDIQHAADSSRYNIVTINGLSGSNKLLIFRDGIRIDAPLGDAIPIDSNFSLAGVDRIEIAYGPASAVYGPDAQGGVVNLITRKPGAKTEISADMSSGQFNQRQLNFWLGKRKDDWTFSLSAQYQASDTADLSHYYPNVYTATDARNFGGTVIVPANSREPFQAPVSSNTQSLRFSWLTTELGWDHWFFRQQSSVSSRPSRTLFLDEDRYAHDLNTLWLRHKFALNDRTNARITLTHSQYEIKPESRFDNVFSNFQPAYKYASSTRDWVGMHFDHKTGEARISGGVSYSQNRAIPRTPDLPEPYDPGKGAQDQGQTYPNTTLPIGIYDLKDSNQSAYLQWFQPWTERWRSVAGLRFDQHSRYGSGLTPRLGLVWQPRRSELFKMMYGEAFRAPAYYERYSAFGSFDGSQDSNGNYLGGSFRAPNPSLQPEHLRGYELSWRKQVTLQQEMGLRAYYYRLSDMIAVRTDPIAQQYIDGAVLAQTSSYGNLEHGRSYGIDLDSRAPTSIANTPINLWLVYSLAYGDMTRSNGQTVKMPFLARQKLKLGASIQASPHWLISPRWQLISSTMNNYIDPTGSRQGAAGYGVVDINFQRSFSGGFALIRVDNVFDHRYGNAGFENGGNSTLPSVPQPPRTISLELHLDW